MTIRLATLCCLAILLTGCASDRRLTLEAMNSTATLTVDYPTRVVVGTDAATADFYLTDLPPELWRPDANLAGASGTIVHMHLFLPPAAGRVPMGENASNLNIRYIVIAGGEVGVYAGGGFLYLKGSPMGRHAGGTFNRASMRLIRDTPMFNDILGAAHLSGSFDATKQEESATILAAKVRQLLEMAAKVE